MDLDENGKKCDSSVQKTCRVFTSKPSEFMRKGEKMSQTDKGVLIFSEWFEAMSRLEPRTYKALMCAIYRCQIHGEQPPEFKGKAALVADIIFPFIRRRTASSRAGIKGMQSRYKVNPIIDEILNNREPGDVDCAVSNDDNS